MKKLISFSMTILILALAPVAPALIINIPADYPTIQEGIDAAVNGDTVLVAPGEYTESLDIENKNILLTSQEGPDATTIWGFHRIMGDRVDSTCVLRGFRITTDITDPWSNGNSLVRVVYASPLVTGNIFENNVTMEMGAAFNCGWSGIIIRGNIIRDNFTLWKSGAIQASTGITIEQNIISNNRASGWNCESGDAGGIQISSAGIIRYNLIVANAASRPCSEARGGGIFRNWGSHTHIYNNTIVSNSARSGGSHSLGGGLFLLAQTGNIDRVFRNNIIAFNAYGGGVYAILQDTVQIGWDYNLVFSNGGGDYIGIEPGPHDVQADPLFVDRFSGNYDLLPNSPCIDAGDPDFPLDPDGTRADIGAYYFDQTVGVDDDSEPTGPYQFELRQNYPNPFNSQTIISYYLPEEAVVSLHIFSIAGRFVKVLANKETQQAGEHAYTWNGVDKDGKTVATGIYFYELYVDDFKQSKPMIVIK